MTRHEGRAELHAHRQQEADPKDEPGCVRVRQRRRDTPQPLRRYRQRVPAPDQAGEPRQRAGRAEAGQRQSGHRTSSPDEWAHGDERGGERQHAGAEGKEATQRLGAQRADEPPQRQEKDGTDKKGRTAVWRDQDPAEHQHDHRRHGDDECVGGPESALADSLEDEQADENGRQDPLALRLRRRHLGRRRLAAVPVVGGHGAPRHLPARRDTLSVVENSGAVCPDQSNVARFSWSLGVSVTVRPISSSVSAPPSAAGPPSKNA